MDWGEIDELSALLRDLRQRGSNIADMDEFRAGFGEQSDDERRAGQLLEQAERDGIIGTHLEDGDAMTFTCWNWSDSAKALSAEHSIALIDPEADYSMDEAS